MASNDQPRNENRGTRSREVPANSTASSGNYGKSGLESTHNRNDEAMQGDQGSGVQGNPAGSANRSGGQGNSSQQSNVETDGGAPSRQTSTATDEKGQL